MSGSDERVKPWQMFRATRDNQMEVPWRTGRAYALDNGMRVRCVAHSGWWDILDRFALVTPDTPLAWWHIARYLALQALWNAIRFLAHALLRWGLARPDDDAPNLARGPLGVPLTRLMQLGLRLHPWFMSRVVPPPSKE